MKKIILLLCIILFSVVKFSVVAAESYSQNVMYFANLAKYTNYTTYEDFEDILNYNTIDAPKIKKSEFLPENIYFTKKDNLYCTPVFLDGIKDKMLAMMQIEGSGRFPYLTIYRLNEESKKWSEYYFGDGAIGGLYLVFPLQNPETGKTIFFEEEHNFDNRRLIAYNLLELRNKEWWQISSARAHYVYKLTDEEKEWISPEIIEKIAAFDYSFMGINGDHPSKIERDVDKVKIIAKLWLTSVGYMPSNYDIKITSIKNEEKEVFKIKEGQWGFNIVTKGKKTYLVYIGMGDDWKTGERVSTIEGFMLSVLDLTDLKIVFKSYINPEIKFEENTEVFKRFFDKNAPR